MYPLKIVLVNFRDAGLLSSVREALDSHNRAPEAAFSNVNDTIEKWSWNDKDSHLAVFYVGAHQDVQDLECLKRAFNWPILAIIDAPREQLATLLILANRAGATQVVSMPLDPDDLHSGMDAIGRDHGYQGNEAKSVAISGVTGGCGATTVAINVADAVAALHQRHCVLVELAMQKGMLATYLNVEPTYVLPDLLQTGTKLDLHLVRQALTRIADNFDIVSGAHFQITPVEVTGQDIQRLIEHFQRLADVLIVDVPWTGDEQFLQTLSMANHVVLVAEQNLPSLRSLRLVLDMLKRSNLTAGANGMPVELVINRYDARSQDFPLERIKEVLDRPDLTTIANDYPAVNASVNRGVPLRLGAPRSKALADIERLTQKLFGPLEAPAKNNNNWSLFNRLASVFSRSAAT